MKASMQLRLDPHRNGALPSVVAHPPLLLLLQIYTQLVPKPIADRVSRLEILALADLLPQRYEPLDLGVRCGAPGGLALADKVQRLFCLRIAGSAAAHAAHATHAAHAAHATHAAHGGLHRACPGASAAAHGAGPLQSLHDLSRLTRIRCTLQRGLHKLGLDVGAAGGAHAALAAHAAHAAHAAVAANVA